MKITKKNEIICCPKCSWLPPTEKLWRCTCNYVFNTFASSGVCPKCKFQWEDTCCPNCYKWSPHIDWYLDIDIAIKNELKNLKLIKKK